MRAALGRAVILTLTVLAGACGDLPTTGKPDPATVDASLAGDCVPRDDGTYVCPPISGGPTIPECDPYHYTCGPEDCMESAWSGDETIQSCLPGGGGAPGPGAPSPPPPGGGGGGELPPENPDSCDTDDPVLDDPAVQAGLADLWARSGIDQPQAQRLEHSAWIVRNPDGSHSVVRITSYNVQEPCRINPGDVNAPPGTVAWVHTHPFAARELLLICGPLQREVAPGQYVPVVGRDGHPVYLRYSNQPSQPDRDFMYAVNSMRKMRGQSYLQAYVIDNEQITRYGANGDKDQPFGRCGY